MQYCPNAIIRALPQEPQKQRQPSGILIISLYKKCYQQGREPRVKENIQAILVNPAHSSVPKEKARVGNRSK